MPEQAFISIGSNIEPENYLPQAVEMLREIGKILRISTVYQNPAIASGPQPDYLNATVLVVTSLEPLEIRRRLRVIENKLGRTRGADKYAPRTIDLDLCLYGSLMMNSEELTLPSPDIEKRAYLAVTLAELAPDLPHPITGEPLQILANRLRPGAKLIPRPDLCLCNQ